MNVQFEVIEYSVTLTNSRMPHGYITLHGKHNAWRARVNFFPLADETETTRVELNDKLVETSMNLALMDDVIDVLRNEKPVTVVANTDLNVFVLSTGKEPVGEEEASALLKAAVRQKG